MSQLKTSQWKLRLVPLTKRILDIQNIDRGVLVLPDDVLAHVRFNLTAIRAVGTLEARQKTALVSEMPGQISFPIERLVAIGIRATVDSALPPLPVL